MWSFKGEYTGEAKAYIREKQKKEIKLWAVGLFFMSLIGSSIIASLYIKENLIYVIISFFATFLVISAINVLGIFLEYRKLPKCAININNDGFEVYAYGKWCSLPFYKIEEITEYDDFIALKIFPALRLPCKRICLSKGTGKS